MYGALIGAGVAVGMSLKCGAVSYDDLNLQQPMHEPAEGLTSNLSSRHIGVGSDADVVAKQQLVGGKPLSNPASSRLVDLTADMNANGTVEQWSVVAKPLRCQDRLPQHAGVPVRVCPVPRQSMPFRRAPPLMHAKLL